MHNESEIKEMVEKFLQLFINAVKQSELYGKNHPLTVKLTNELYAYMLDLFNSIETITIGIIGDEFVYANKPLYSLSKSKKEFIRKLNHLKLRKMRFEKGLSLEELIFFIRLLTFQLRSGDSLTAIREVLDKKQIQHIKIGDISVSLEDMMADECFDPEKDARKTIENSIMFLQDNLNNLAQNKNLDTKGLKRITAKLVNSLMINKELLVLMTSLKLQNEDIFHHNLYVCIFTLLQAELLGLNHKHMVDIAGAALLHNMGHLLDQAKTPQDDDDYCNMDKAKRAAGVKWIFEAGDVSLLSAVTAFECHIPYDRHSGSANYYGESLNMASMMIAIACAYDRLRRGKGCFEGRVEKIHDYMIGMGGKRFHPDLLNNFFSIIGAYPPGTLVELESGETGLVLQSSLQSIKRPKIKILYDAAGNRLTEPTAVHCMEKNRKGLYKYTIKQSISSHEYETINPESFFEKQPGIQ